MAGGKIPREKTLNDDFKLQQSRATMSPTSRENGRKTWRGPRRWDIHTSALLIFRRLEVSRKTMEIQAFSSALADGIEISLRRRNPIVDREGQFPTRFLNRFPYLFLTGTFRCRFRASPDTFNRSMDTNPQSTITNLLLDRAWWAFVLRKQATDRVDFDDFRELEKRDVVDFFLRSFSRGVKIPFIDSQTLNNERLRKQEKRKVGREWNNPRYNRCEKRREEKKKKNSVSLNKLYNLLVLVFFTALQRYLTARREK